ncbi:TylF/MycF family methyltransferase, partial [Patescibacteria group bacterium]|nr:TylF/MycF family methyltransferase [Patescibacteria group bacterium]
MNKDAFKKIALSTNPIVRGITNALRFPLRYALFLLLKFRKEAALPKLIHTIQHERDFMMWPDEMTQIACCMQYAAALDGDVAEVGVSSAGSAKLIAELKGEKMLHLFDTYEGLPEPGNIDKGFLKQQYACSLESVKTYLSNYHNVVFYKGLFPSTAVPAQDMTFAFVHLDVDLYQSTLDGLKFFYPRLVSRGILLSHDYSTFPGVRKAFDEFFSDKQERIVELAT